MALAYKVYTYRVAVITQHHSHITISTKVAASYNLAEISTAATYIRMVMWEWCCVIIIITCTIIQSVPYHTRATVHIIYK